MRKRVKDTEMAGQPTSREGGRYDYFLLLRIKITRFP